MKKKPSSDIKVKRLNNLINEFLEKDLTRDYLRNKPDEVESLKKIIEDNLWDGKIGPYDRNWDFESSECIEDISKQNKDEIDWILKEKIDRNINNIFHIYEVLKNFWEEFKTALFDFNNRITIDPLYTPPGYCSSDAINSGIAFDEAFLNLNKTPADHEIIFVNFYETGIKFFPLSTEAVRHLMDLIEIVKPQQFKQCADKGCGKVFILTSKHKREYCCSKCAARTIQRNKRTNSREKYNEYYRNYNKQTRSKIGQSNKGRNLL